MEYKQEGSGGWGKGVLLIYGQHPTVSKDSGGGGQAI